MAPAAQATTAAPSPAGATAPAAAQEAPAAPAQAQSALGQIPSEFLGGVSPEVRRTLEVYQRALNDPRIQQNPERVKAILENIDRLVPGAKEAQIAKARRDAEKLSNAPRIELTLANRQLQTQTVKDKIDEAIANTGYTSAGLASATSVVGMTPANTLKGALETIRSNIGFSELQKMRDESPTGGALGQVAVQELNYLQAALGSLDQSQKPEVLIANLKKIKNILDRYEKIRVNAFERDYGRKPDIQRLLRDPGAVEEKAAAAGATPQASNQLRADPAALSQARAAISAGANPAAIRQRLRERGFSDEGL
jgi:hypothetical protein